MEEWWVVIGIAIVVNIFWYKWFKNFFVDRVVLNENNMDSVIKKEFTVVHSSRKTKGVNVTWNDVVACKRRAVGAAETEKWLIDNADIFSDCYFIRHPNIVFNSPSITAKRYRKLDATKVWGSPHPYAEKIGWYHVYKDGIVVETVFGEDVIRAKLKENFLFV